MLTIYARTAHRLLREHLEHYSREVVENQEDNIADTQNIDKIKIYTKTMTTCDEVLTGQIYVGREEPKVRSIWHCAMLEEDGMLLVTEADVSGYDLDISKKKQNTRTVGYGSFLERDTNRNMEKNGIRQKLSGRLKHTALSGEQNSIEGSC